MKAGIKFIATYSMLSMGLFGISKLIFKELTIEIFSYLLYYYVITLGIGVILYPVLSWALEKYNTAPKLKLVLSLLILFFILNCVPFFYDNGRVLTFDVVKGIFADHSLLGHNNLGVHIIAIISFVSSYLLYRNDNYWIVNVTNRKAAH